MLWSSSGNALSKSGIFYYFQKTVAWVTKGIAMVRRCIFYLKLITLTLKIFVSAFIWFANSLYRSDSSLIRKHSLYLWKVFTCCLLWKLKNSRRNTMFPTNHTSPQFHSLSAAGLKRFLIQVMCLIREGSLGRSSDL